MVHIGGMTLLEYLRAKGLKPDAFAEAIGETENIVRKWAYRQRQPSLPNAIKIQDATDGQVTARELLLPAASEAGQ
jgi:DNA-binding transcriptional regulator YdaS (Cro superfamily)